MTAPAQLALDLSPLTEPDYEPHATIQERYDAWITANSWVLAAMERLVGDWIAAGHSRVGIKQMWEVIRWQYGATTGDTFKANNDYTSRVARDLLATHPDWEPYIEIRALRAP